MGSRQLAAATRRAGPGHYGILDLPQRVTLQLFGHVLRALDHPHQQFELGNGLEMPVGVQRTDQPVGFLFVAHVLGLGAVEHEFGQRLDEEIDPFAAGIFDLMIDREDRLGLVAGNCPSPQPRRRSDWITSGESWRSAATALARSANWMLMRSLVLCDTLRGWQNILKSPLPPLSKPVRPGP
ncbi:hypothetical protein PF049_02395 [Erythrobacteraceae bacterium WH01K]|nr:hypothetical protein PF049_02395 [Erythrobacteraceae bacterium WH01K]